MPKSQYVQCYRPEWEKDDRFKIWIESVPRDKTKARCRYCKVVLISKLYDLKKHMETLKHKNSMKPVNSKTQNTICFPKENDNLAAKEAQASMALFIADHCSLRTSNHLSQLCQKYFAPALAKNITLGRTKCANLIRNVLGPHFRNLLVEEIGMNPYSLIIDEATDIAVHKKLGVVVRYFDSKKSSVISTFLGLVQLKDGNADAIVEGLDYLLRNLNLPKKNLVSLGTDNASVMTGINNGVYVKIKELWNLPHLILIRCTCHSLQLALSAASEAALPRNLEFMLREIYNWFSVSTKRQQQFADMYKLINNERNPIKFPKTCETRWVSIEPAVSCILAQWEELKLHFRLARNTCYTSELLYCMLNDSVNYCYFVYLRMVLKDFQNLMKAFESEHNDPTKLLDDLLLLLRSLASRIINPTAKIDIFQDNIDDYLDPNPYLGYDFNKALNENNLDVDNRHLVTSRCIKFTNKLFIEVRSRLPDRVMILQKMSLLSVEKCLNPLKPNIIELCELLGESVAVDEIIIQWNNLHTIQWSDNSNTYGFWAEVYKYRDCAGNNPFHQLASLAVKILVLPHSNAEVERVFSQMSIVKNKLRNKLVNETVNAILYIKSYLRNSELTCVTYKFPNSLLKVIGTNVAYSLSNVDSNLIEDDDDIIELIN